ncbi:MAG TPA: hypothetical protein VK177_02610 [Flavobacteriales bacterium]|nr:hypothetical protein [Flavobacteriales bacterium]
MYSLLKPKASTAAGLPDAGKNNSPNLISRIKKKIAVKRVDAKLSGNAEIIFYSFPAVRTFFDNKWFNKYFDGEIERLNVLKKKSLVLEVKGEKPNYYTDVFHKNNCVFIEDHFESKVWSLNGKIKEAKSSLNSYSDFIEELGVLVPDLKLNDISVTGLEKRFLQFSKMTDYFSDILERNKTKIVFVVCYYEFKAMALCCAARSKKIPVVDIQHGLQGSYHAAYGSWESFPVEGYKTMPSLFWCWNEEDAAVINQWASRTNNFHVAFKGGDPWLNMWKSRASKFVADYDIKIEKLQRNQKNPFNIIFTAQPIDDAFPSTLVEAINSSPKNWIWWIRLHPRQMETVEQVKMLLNTSINKNVIIEEATSLPLPALLRNMHVNITKWSSVVLEASTMGIPSIVLHQNGVDIYSSLFNQGKVVLVDGKEKKLVNVLTEYCNVKSKDITVEQSPVAEVFDIIYQKHSIALSK